MQAGTNLYSTCLGFWRKPSKGHVCTIEKANSLVNAATEDGKFNQLGIVVMDEFHMLDGENHCFLIELTITRLLCLQQGIQIIGMSATLSGSRLIADWFGAKFYCLQVSPSPD
jgi:replicative superfamily II helicase